MNKKGQIQISFGMIFSIIIIIATVAVGFYLINYFLDMSSCTKTSLFLDSLTNEVDKAWIGDITQTVFKGNLPSGIEYVCFGDLSSGPGSDAATNKMLLELKDYGENEKNVFLYPPKKACELAFYDLEHARSDGFFCVEVKSGAIDVKLSKVSTDALVTLSKPDSTSTASGQASASKSTSSSASATPSNNSGICQKAEEDSLCEGLSIAYGNAYKQWCCSSYNLCC